MQLESLKYSEFQDTPREWQMEEVRFDDVTLVVGKNASGKTRTINVIAGLGRMLAGVTKPLFTSGHYQATFADGGERYHYEVNIRNSSVLWESFRQGNRMLLTRGPDGVGKIFAEKVGKELEFQTPPSEIAVVSRRDSLQHSFFERLYEWGVGTRHFQFGTAIGKDLLFVVNSDKNPPYNPQDTNAVSKSLKEGIAAYGETFLAAIIADMARIDYRITALGLRTPQNIVFQGIATSGAVCIFVKESELKGETEQFEMSQGMFRALSILIQINYAQFSKSPSCILIDDIGEGLDFERSCGLVELLIEKATNSKVQLIMSTNDRFVMNRVPLQYWAIIQRKGGVCRFFNYGNSKKQFDDFKFTGMNNFDFFATDFLGAGRTQDEEARDFRRR